ncbi:MAG: HflX-like GTP-binding protein [Candidatus Poseidoniales archaeon]
MGEPTKIANPLLAGAGGVTLGEARTNHQGRKAILMIRNEENSGEFEALVATMGIEIVERINQSGKEDPRSYFGKGRLQDVADELAATVDGHPWKSVDLVIMQQQDN